MNTVTISIPGSKSYTNRALIMAALTKGEVVLHNPLYSDDTEAMLESLRTLGLRIETSSEKMIVYDDISAVQKKHYELFARDSGTTIRFLLALLCLVPGTKILRGSARLNERPIQELVDGLRQLGAEIEYLDQVGFPPLKISSSHLHVGKASLPGDVSSQYFSALLMIAPYVGALTIDVLGNQISKPYIDMTIDTMQAWNVTVQNQNYQSYFLQAGQSYSKKEYVIEGDFSSAGYFFAVAVLTKSTITLENLNPHSKQADRNFLEILKRMGNEVIDHPSSVTIIGKQILPMTLDMESCPDQVQTMAVLAAFADGVTHITGVRSLRVKETERVVAIKNELAKMGIRTEDTHDSLTIYGGQPHAATIDTYNDHRMAMSFAVAGMVLAGMKINHPEVVGKTFPTFWEKLQCFSCHGWPESKTKDGNI